MLHLLWYDFSDIFQACLDQVSTYHCPGSNVVLLGVMQAGQQDACFDGVEGTDTTDCNDGQGSFKDIIEFLWQILIKYSDSR